MVPTQITWKSFRAACRTAWQTAGFPLILLPGVLPRDLSCDKGENPPSNSTEIQRIRAVRLLQNCRMLQTTRQHTPEAHFLRSVSLEGLMRPDFSLHSYPAVNSPRFGSQQKPAKTVTGSLGFFLWEAQGFFPLAADARIEKHG